MPPRLALAVLLAACGDPDPPTPPAPTVEAVTEPATSLGLAAFSANGRIQPHGAPARYFFEYGPTEAYGMRTPARRVAPRLAAYYREDWDAGLGGWRGGAGTDLVHVATGGAAGGFARYREPTGDDYNHVDGIGLLHLVQYFYPGIFEVDYPSAALGGADPDLRDARVSLQLRGVDWVTSGSELLFWDKSARAHGDPLGPVGYSNWAHTGAFLTDPLLTGAWEPVTYRLTNDTRQWTYAGTNRELGREIDYQYSPLDDVLGHLDVDFFHLLAFTNVEVYPSGAIDFDQLEIAYRNHSLLIASNGGALAAAPAGSADDPAALTDGWRFGDGRMWAGPPDPSEPIELVYAFAEPVTVRKVQIHNHTEVPSRQVEVLVSADGAEWTSIAAGTLPDQSEHGPNFTFVLFEDLAAPAAQLKVRIIDGYRAEAWGLGEIEVFGDGPPAGTDDDWYSVNEDVTGLDAGATYHYRLVVETAEESAVGEDRGFTVPADATPEVATGEAYRIAGGGARLQGRLNTLGAEAQVWFEWGLDDRFGQTTPAMRAGPEMTPRSVVATLSGLTPGATIHYRLVAEGAGGIVQGAARRFAAR